MRSRPASAATSISKVERGRWKLVSKRADFAILRRCAFEQAQTRRSDSDDAAALAPRSGDLCSRLSCEQPPLGMHMVFAGIVNLDRQKRAGSDVEGQRCPANSAVRERLQQGWSEVKPGRRRRNGALASSKDRLIIRAVARIATA
jgi:hypothetical protein